MSSSVSKFLSRFYPAIFLIKSTVKKDASTLRKAVSSLSCLLSTGGHVHVGLVGKERRLSLDDAG